MPTPFLKIGPIILSGSQLRARLFALLLGLCAAVNPAFALDVNKANLEDLQTVEGVGPVIAKRIVDERRRGGQFSSKEDLIARVKGVGDKTAGKITAGSGLKKGSKTSRNTSSTASRSSSNSKSSTSKKTAKSQTSPKKSTT